MTFVAILSPFYETGSRAALFHRKGFRLRVQFMA